MASFSCNQVEERVQERLESTWGQCTRSQDEKLTCVSTPELHKLIRKLDKKNDTNMTRSCRWNAILQHCRSHPEQINMVDGRGRTCLSTACARDPPLAVIQTMLGEVFPSKNRRCFRSPLYIRDKTGWTAMAIAIANHASLDVIRLLATQPDLVSTTDHYGNTPLHLACQYRYRRASIDALVQVLLEAGDACLAGRENNEGKTPLHVAIENRASTQVVRMLAEACPDSVVNNSCGYTPLFSAISNFALQTCRILVQVHPQVTHVPNEVGRLPLYCALQMKVRDSKLVKLLCTFQQAVLDCDGIHRNALHLALERNVNPCIVETLLQTAPQAARAFGGSAVQTCYRRYLQAAHSSSVDKEWTVLCMVLRAYNNCDPPINNVLHAALETNAPARVIQRVLCETPLDAKQPNDGGRYPLAIACEMQVPVEEKDAIIHSILNAGGGIETDNQRSVLSILAEYGGVSSHTLHRIICINPTALTALDPKLQMYPFMIASLATEDEQDDLIHVGAIFELLSASPNLVHL